LKRQRWALALFVLVAATGCSSVKFGYNRLDWIVSWQLGRFVDLDRQQKELVTERLRVAWDWHRGTQLALYARDLRELAARVDRPLDAAEVERWLARSQEHADRTLRELVPDIARVLGTFGDAQVRELLENMAERRAERAGESAGLTDGELRERAQARMLKGLKRWIGAATRDQQRRIADWSGERRYAGATWQQYEEAWAAAFADALKQRSAPEFGPRLAALFDDARVPSAEEMERLQQHNRRAWVGLMADLSASLTDAQRRRMRDRIGDLAADFEALSAQARPAPAPAAAGGISEYPASSFSGESSWR
jgi:hypothetical protein